MSDPRATGIEVSLKRRRSGHDGIATEWEITTADADAKAVIRALPILPLISHDGPGDDGPLKHGIYLPEGVTPLLAGEIAASLSSLDDDALAAALHRASADGATYLTLVCQAERLGVWAATQDTFTAAAAALAIGVDEWRAQFLICRYLSGRAIPLNDGLAWKLTPEELKRAGCEAGGSK